MMGRLRPGPKRKSGRRYACGKLMPADVRTKPQTMPFKPYQPLRRASAAVYVLAAAEVTKVGVSHDIRSRISSLQVGQHREISFRWAIWLRREDAYKVEGAVHRNLVARGLHSNGEWHFVDPDVAIETVKQFVRKMGITYETFTGIALHEKPVGQPLASGAQIS